MIGLHHVDLEDRLASANLLTEHLVVLAGFEARYDLVFVANEDAVIISIEARVEHELGYQPGDVVGRGIWEYVHPNDVAAVSGAFAGVIAYDDRASRANAIRLRRADVGWRRCEFHGHNFVDDVAVRGVVVGVRFTSAPTTQRMPGSIPAASWELLTLAEREIVTAVSSGLSNREIAVGKQKSIRTVESQLRAIYRKLALESRRELVAEILAR